MPREFDCGPTCHLLPPGETKLNLRNAVQQNTCMLCPRPEGPGQDLMTSVLVRTQKIRMIKAVMAAATVENLHAAKATSNKTVLGQNSSALPRWRWILSNGTWQQLPKESSASALCLCCGQQRKTCFAKTDPELGARYAVGGHKQTLWHWLCCRQSNRDKAKQGGLFDGFTMISCKGSMNGRLRGGT